MISAVRIYSEHIENGVWIIKVCNANHEEREIGQNRGDCYVRWGLLCLEDIAAYKYLGILEGEIRHEEGKGRTIKEYFRRIRTILRSTLDGGNIVRHQLESCGNYQVQNRHHQLDKEGVTEIIRKKQEIIDNV